MEYFFGGVASGMIGLSQVILYSSDDLLWHWVYSIKSKSYSKAYLKKIKKKPNFIHELIH